MRVYLLLAAFSLLHSLAAQTDTLKPIRLSGIRVDLSTNFATGHSAVTQKKYQEIVSNDEYLNRDFGGYESQGYYYSNGYGGMTDIRFYGALAGRGKIAREVFIGLRYGRENTSGLGFNKTIYDTIGRYVEPNTKDVQLNILTTDLYYNFVINSHKLFIPLGLNLTTNKTKYVWFTAGIEFVPSLNFGYTFNSSYDRHSREIFIREGDSIRYDNSFTNYSNTIFTSSKRETKLSGVGLGFYLATPLSANLRFSKSVRFLKHLNLSVSLAPAFVYVRSKYSGSSYAAAAYVSAGLRYNW